MNTQSDVRYNPRQPPTMKVISLLLTVGVLTAGTPINEQGRVSGGLALSAAVPHLVSITLDGQHVCGGFIYSSNWIVTAASCVNGVLPSQVKVVVAQVSLIQQDIDEQVISVFKIYIHEGYQPTTKLHDIAMLQTASTMTFGPRVNFIRYEEAEEVSGTVVKLAGWGATTVGGTPSTKLREITVTIPASCSGMYTAEEFTSNYMLCAGGSPADIGSPCQYDEGSPLVQTIGTTSYAVGIMSKNQGCGAGFAPTIYTRLSAYYAWLNKIGGLQPVL
ncbi:complement factor D-like [Daphnia carinata]|uniref:complement factor D-like n=1 Tax=Daphnia carinata TaxID=120202 RepID=UPI00257D9D55|nr:complement factor D-like [Daphnia carinata]